MVLVLCANIWVTEKNRISEYKIIVYADHLSFLGKWSFFLRGDEDTVIPYVFLQNSFLFCVYSGKI